MIVNGLLIGKVAGLQDPQGRHRILINLPTLDNEGTGIWARLASFDAGAASFALK